MGTFDRERLSERECERVFAELFPLGLGGDDVLAQIAPTGWDRSPLLHVFHPSPEQVYRESLRIHRNLERLLDHRRSGPPRPEATLEEIRAGWRDEPVVADREVSELVGMCLWDVFSDNHDVIAPDGRVVDIGSFRGAGGFIAELLDRRGAARRYDYMDFYMGTVFVGDRADLTPVYVMIFRRLAARGYDWEYSFPRLYLVDLSGFAETDRPPDVAKELERERELGELREVLDEGHREAIEAAKDRPPPLTVQAYRRVYGDFPRRWPPWE